VSSANFTQRTQEQNIEVGVLIDDASFASFASFLAGQRLGLIEAGIVGEYVPSERAEGVFRFTGLTWPSTMRRGPTPQPVAAVDLPEPLVTSIN
jgi:phosphatidylserine/phosphatidylglycerophosphate/cardiolipin synthase-like enzyme